MICKNCSREFSDGAKFCPHCGFSNFPQDSYADNEKQTASYDSPSGFNQSNSHADYQNNNAEYQNNNGGYQNNNAEYQNNNGGYQNNNAEYQNNNGGYQNNNAEYQNNNGGYQNNNGGYQNNNGGYQNFSGYNQNTAGYGSNGPYNPNYQQNYRNPDSPEVANYKLAFGQLSNVNTAAIVFFFIGIFCGFIPLIGGLIGGLAEPVAIVLAIIVKVKISQLPPFPEYSNDIILRNMPQQLKNMKNWSTAIIILSVLSFIFIIAIVILMIVSPLVFAEFFESGFLSDIFEEFL